jgi:GxxExxY protein
LELPSTLERFNAKYAKSRKGRKMDAERERIEATAKLIVESGICVHRELGPGLLESTYQQCLAHELKVRGLSVQREVGLPVRYQQITIPVGYRIDMIVDDLVIVENKSLQAVLPIHQMQVLTYLRLSNRKLGFLINWNVPRLKDGLQRVVNRL